MKKAKVLLGIFISILILPFTVLAEENQKVNVYFFLDFDYTNSR